MVDSIVVVEISVSQVVVIDSVEVVVSSVVEISVSQVVVVDSVVIVVSIGIFSFRFSFGFSYFISVGSLSEIAQLD